MKPGTLYLIPSLLSDDLPQVLPPYALSIVHQLDEFIVENEKTARHFLKALKTPIPQPQFVFHLLNEHTTDKDIPTLLLPLQQGKNIGLMSEAGAPGVADPGSAVVQLAHEAGIRVVPLIGPSGILMALMASGMNGQSFRFHGYLPREIPARKSRIRELAADALKKHEAQIFIETPYRNDKLLEDILSTAPENVKLCIACEITGNRERINTRTIHDWKKTQIVIGKLPCVFILGS
jgi:16S rRNA (cytidine1402-2'-O)-methyltransferase